MSSSTGLVIKNAGSAYRVQMPDGRVLSCKIKGNFRLKGIRSTNPIAVGDEVEIDYNGEETSYITNIHQRKNYIIRRSSNLSKESHILAANITQTVLVVTISHPETNLTFIDRFLATSEAYSVPAMLLFNKTDLYDKDETEFLNAVINMYENIGYQCLKISASTLEGIDNLRKRLVAKTTLFSGNSGVGKSTIINLLIPELSLKIGEISQSHHKGMHTTTFSQMYPLPESGYVIDTPGIKGFGTIDFNTKEVSHYFPEIFKASSECKYGDCTHRNEPGCAVLKALQEHKISESRYSSYLSIIDDMEEGKYRAAY